MIFQWSFELEPKIPLILAKKKGYTFISEAWPLELGHAGKVATIYRQRTVLLFSRDGAKFNPTERCSLPLDGNCQLFLGLLYN